MKKTWLKTVLETHRQTTRTEDLSSWQFWYIIKRVKQKKKKAFAPKVELNHSDASQLQVWSLHPGPPRLIRARMAALFRLYKRIRFIKITLWCVKILKVYILNFMIFLEFKSAPLLYDPVKLAWLFWFSVIAVDPRKKRSLSLWDISLHTTVGIQKLSYRTLTI